MGSFDELPTIHPASPVPVWWLVVGLVLLAVAVALPVVARAWWVRSDARGAGRRITHTQRLRTSALTRAEASIAQFRDGTIPASRAVQVVGEQLRTFVGAVAGTDLDLMTLTELDTAAATDRRLEPVADYVRRVYPVAFAGQDHDGDDRVSALLDEGRELIATWH